MKKVLIVVLVLIEVFSIHLLYKSYNNKKVLEEEEPIGLNNTKLAIMLQDNSGKYNKSSDTTFPSSGYSLNLDKSECLDIEGNKIANAISGNNGSITLTNKFTSYCTLYFDKCLQGQGTVLAGKSQISACPVGGMYRYQGATVNNYICFGTNAKATCIGDPDKYMYRIIGVTLDNHLKIMKENDIGVIYWINEDNYTVQYATSNFFGSNLYTQINGEAFLSNTTYMPSTWSNKIYAYNYYNGKSNDFDSNTVDNIYKIETGKINSSGLISQQGKAPTVGVGDVWKSNSFKIGLPYVHDYLYSIANNTNNCSTSGSCSASWMKYSKTYPTMSLCGSKDQAYPCGVWAISSNGYISNTSAFSQERTDSYNIKPTFYLNSNITLSSATGSSTDPFLITN